jgi:biopolymer transport protein ExbB
MASSPRYLATSALALAVSLLSTASAAAQGPAAQTAPPVERPNTIVDMFSNAGTVGYIIVLLSIVGLALVIENFITLKREKMAPPELVDELEALFDEENFQEAIEVCENEKNYLCNSVAAGLSKLGHPFETIQASYKEMADEEAVKLFQKIGWLSLIAAVAPMMGLLGTVGGMFDTFGEIAAKKGSVNPSDLAGGIKFALVTTIFGLIVAIPVSSAFYYLRNRVVNATLETNAILADLFERFREKEKAAA